MPGRGGEKNSPRYGWQNLPAVGWSIGICSSGIPRSLGFPTRTVRAGGRMVTPEWMLLSVLPDTLRSTLPRARMRWIWARRIRRECALLDTVVSQVWQEASFDGRCVQCGSARQRRRIRELGGSKAGSCVWTPASFYGVRGNEHGIIWREAGSASYLLNEPGQTRRLLVPMSSYGALSPDAGKTENGG
jgi:hypothetical protein